MKRSSVFHLSMMASVIECTPLRLTGMPHMIEKQVERKFEPFLFDEKVGADIVEGGVAYLPIQEISCWYGATQNTQSCWVSGSRCCRLSIPDISKQLA